MTEKEERSLARASGEARRENGPPRVTRDLEGDVLALERVSQEVGSRARVARRIRGVDADILREKTHGLMTGEAVRVAVDVAHDETLPRSGKETGKAKHGDDDSGSAAIEGQPPKRVARELRHAFAPGFPRAGSNATAAPSARAERALIKSPIFTHRVGGRNRTV